MNAADSKARPRKMDEGGDEFFTKRDLATRWKCSTKKLDRLIKAKHLIAHIFGTQVRISRADALAYERANRQS
jgi:excisionase family DNA binding protein